MQWLIKDFGIKNFDDALSGFLESVDKNIDLHCSLKSIVLNDNIRLRANKSIKSYPEMVYFPEYKYIYGFFDAIIRMMLLKQAALPEDIIKLGVEKINHI